MPALNLYQTPYDLEAPLCDLWLMVPTSSLPQQKAFMCLSCQEAKREEVTVIMGRSEAGFPQATFAESFGSG